jgi:excisionase family DNA binding protein
MPNDLADVRFLTVAEVADMLRVSKMTVYRLVHSGELPAIRFGRSFRVPETAVAEVLARPASGSGLGSVPGSGPAENRQAQ